MPDASGWRVTGIDDDGAGFVDPGPGGRRIVVAGALPGDRVRWSDDSPPEIESMPSPARRDTRLCSHYPACGGCRVHHMSDATYTGWKSGKLESALAARGIELPNPREPLRAVSLRTRRRVVLTAKAEGGHYALGFHEHRSHTVIDLDDCAVITPAIVAALGAFKEIARIVSGGGECRLTVLDVGNGLDVSIETVRQRRLEGAAAALTAIAAKARILRITINSEPLLMRAKPLLAVSSVAVEPPPGVFVQAAAEAEAAMVEIATEAIVAARAKTAADLFSGLGAFTFAIARRALLLAIDNDRAAIAALNAGARSATGLKPIEAKVRDLFRDPLSPRELDRIDAVVFDPPRAGAQAQAKALAASKVKAIVAVSCNLSTLARDLRLLIDGGYRLDRAVAVDQFLFTPHLEAVAILSR